jgi:hypothetical protein
MKFDDIRTEKVSESVSLDCVDGAGQTMTLPGELGYTSSDPYAVTMIFQTAGGNVVWTFARDLMVRGLTAPAGDGDVHVWPCLDADGQAVVIVELHSPDGELLVQVATKDVYRFVNRTLAAVPLGTEGEHLDLDVLIGQLMAA